MMSILPNMEYYSIFSYCTKCPEGYSRESDLGRTLMKLIKNDREVPTSHDDVGGQKEFAFTFVARVVSEHPGLWPGFFGPRVALVPIPRTDILSSPRDLRFLLHRRCPHHALLVRRSYSISHPFYGLIRR